ncbi:hypothetical protein BpHYR1_003793 [Brachionus plicatilis]|uniref:Uncharacterized protein n=1 Tax=Brachionus plicatilis TaxID=10195 RepID=A0A3M7RNP2_BRAPC|nr:hypothetical protein BpHYR1_003793 [Brachionus plicatilis]
MKLNNLLKLNHIKMLFKNIFIAGAILQNLHRFCRLPQKVKQQLFQLVSFTEQFCLKFHNANLKIK